MYRICRGCKAINIPGNEGRCGLAYQTDSEHPLEACPKPKTWKEYIKHMEERAIAGYAVTHYGTE